MQVGDLVKYDGDGDIGIIIEVCYDGDYHVMWADGKQGWHVFSEIEVINASR